MTTVAAADFRAVFPEFGDATIYPDAQIAFWLTQSPNQIEQRRFGTSTDLATMLYVAHNLALSPRLSGGTTKVASAQGPVSSKSVGGVLYSYDNSLTATQGAGAWNATSYGQRLLALMRSFLGPVYVPGRVPFPPPGFVLGYRR